MAEKKTEKANGKKLEFTTRLTREDAAGIIEALIESLKEGRLKVQKSGESLELEVPRVVDLEVEASISPCKAKFEVEISWRPNREENPDINECEAHEKKSAKATPKPKPKPKATPKPKPE